MAFSETTFVTVAALSAFTLVHYLLILSSFTKGDVFIELSPIRVFLAIAVHLAIAVRAVRKRQLTVAAASLGFVLMLCSYSYAIMLLTFFLTSTRLTKYKQDVKRKMTQNVDKSCRNWEQVLANGGLPLQISLIALVEFGIGCERPIDFEHNYTGAWYDIAVLGAFCAVAGDTWASEVGLVGSQPLLITTFQKVPRGTNGGITLIGTLASAMGGLCVGLGHFCSIQLLSNTHSLSRSCHQALLIPFGAFLGLVGSAIDSLLGATLQFSGWDKQKSMVVETPDKSVERISGCECLGHNCVNFCAALFTALLSPTVGYYLWGYYCHLL